MSEENEIDLDNSVLDKHPKLIEFLKLNKNPSNVLTAAMAETLNKAQNVDEEMPTESYEPEESSVEAVNVTNEPINVNCPILDCNQSINEFSLLTHFLTNHKADIDFKVIAHEHHAIIQFEISKFEYEKHVCLGYLLYGSNESEHLITQKAWAFNSVSPELLSTYEHFPPVIVMACLTSWKSMLQDDKIAAKCSDECNDMLQILVIWLVGTDATLDKVFVLRAYDGKLVESRSMEVNPRSIKDSQIPAEFIKHETNLLVLSKTEIRLLSQNHKDKIILEVFPQKDVEPNV